MKNFIEVDTAIRYDAAFLEMRKAHDAAFVGLTDQNDRRRMSGVYHNAWREHVERLRQEVRSRIAAETGLAFYQHLKPKGGDQFVACIGWLKEQSFLGNVGFGTEFASAIRYVVRDTNGSWRASRRKEAARVLTEARSSSELFFSDSRDATLFKLTWA